MQRLGLPSLKYCGLDSNESFTVAFRCQSCLPFYFPTVKLLYSQRNAGCPIDSRIPYLISASSQNSILKGSVDIVVHKDDLVLLARALLRSLTLASILGLGLILITLYCFMPLIVYGNEREADCEKQFLRLSVAQDVSERVRAVLVEF